jgi:hypothetical protein
MDINNFREKLLNFTSKVTAWHTKIFTYLIEKSKTNVWFAYLLLFVCVYEIVEHFIIPVLILYFGLR